MARCPFAEWVPITPTEKQRNRTITPTGLVCHTAVSNSTLLRPTGEVRWHFYLNKTGQLYQFFDTGIYAPCHRDGNYWTSGGKSYGFLSCESWDGAGTIWDGENVAKLPPWNDAQMKTWARLGAWLHDAHGIELVKATGPRGRGIGFHAQYTTPADKPGLRWNISHACPGPKRIAQMPTMIAAMRAAVEEEDMPLSDADVKRVAKAVWDHRLDPGPFAERVGGYPSDTTYPAGGLQVGGDAYGRETHREVVPRIVALEAKANELDHQQDARHKELHGLLTAQAAAINALTEKVEALTNKES